MMRKLVCLLAFGVVLVLSSSVVADDSGWIVLMGEKEMTGWRSTGAWQPIDQLGKLCQEFGTLLLVDAVTSLGCVPLKLDEWEIDAVYSCTQKGLGCPPGLAPMTAATAAKIASKVSMLPPKNPWGRIARVFRASLRVAALRNEKAPGLPGASSSECVELSSAPSPRRGSRTCS